jgi:hypothetical protein
MRCRLPIALVLSAACPESFSLYPFRFHGPPDVFERERLQGCKPVAENLRPDPVIENALDPDFSLHHRPGYGAEFDTDFMVRGDSAQILVRYKETYPYERGVAQVH